MLRLLALLLMAGPALAEAICGAADAPCQVDARQYHLVLPEGDGPFPVVIFFHGSGGNAADLLRPGYQGLVTGFTARGYAFLAPAAERIPFQGGAATGWRWGRGQGDFAFVSALIADALDRFPLDGSRIYAAGQSHGGAFLWYLACSGAEPRIAGYVPMAGALLIEQPESCADGIPVAPLLHIHGEGDNVVPLSGKPSTPMRFGLRPMGRVTRDMAERAGCAGGRRERDGGFRILIWDDCPGGLRLGLALHPGGHAPPPDWPALAIRWFEAGR